ncbi:MULTISPECIES: IS4 family transposase [Myroides]|uniref:IS4 family transposase n=1 Tax=Myroides TaxID=76831 RepID=UPI00132477FE|nr:MULTISPECIES: IS4 family transposase [Myroides]MVX36730.1 IS4 family transposase [Myroides sp. LoEW2-1]UVD78842.1 IS4 family transposase [Myroides albus]UVD78986.1 IS4 family transposase [Myroides albus]UVD79319.1 IS4 family transposase [Myroides albus]UVD79403.1 IS4 family transposase [Myroides albus]
MTNVTLFSQIIQKLDRSKFKKIVKERQTDKHNKGFDSWSHLVSMLFCHFARSKSVRDISNGLRSATGNLNHLGLTIAPSKSSISYQNKKRSHELFKEYYFTLLESLGQHPKFKQVKFRIKSKILLLDSTTISLCLSIFDWAKYKTNKGAVKMHTLLDFDGNLPAYINITNGKTADNKGAYDIPLLKGSVIVADRFYNDFSLLNVWDSKQVFFVIRHKDNLKFETIKELELPENRHQNILKDELISLTNTRSKQIYPKKLRRVAVWDEQNNQVIELITNQFNWTANTISELYKSRWMVEIFFRDLKQLLHIKSFIGTSENAVMIQIWTALITILILKALRAQSKFKWHLSNLVAFIRLNLFVKIQLKLWLDNPLNEVEKPPPKLQQGVLF